MTSLSNLAKRLKEAFNRNDFNKADPLSYRLTNNAVGRGLESAQRWLENPNSRVNIPTPKISNTNPLSAPIRLTKSVIEGVATEPLKVGGDFGQMLTRGTKATPASYPVRLGQNLVDYKGGASPFATVGNYGAGKWTLPVLNKRLPELGLSESPLANTAGMALRAFEPVTTAMGAKNLKGLAGYLGLSGGVNALLGDKSLPIEQRFIQGASEAAPKAAQTVGFVNATNKLMTLPKGVKVPSKIKLLKYPTQSGANVLQGVAQDKVMEQETSGTSVLIDALFPAASELTGRSFKSLGDATRAVDIKVQQTLGKKLRNNKGWYTTADKFAKGTRAYRKNKELNGLALGFEPYQDEDGTWKVKFNRDRALLGLGLTAGITKTGDLAERVTKDINGNPLVKKVPQAFKTEKFNVTKGEDEALYGLLKKMGIDERTVRSFDEMKAVATELLGDPNKLLKDVTQGRIKDSEIVALGDIINTSSKRIDTLTKQLEKTPNDAKLLSDLDNETTLINQAIRKRVKGGTEAGRAVVAFRILANKTLSPEYWLAKAQKQLGDARQLKPDEVTAINQLIEGQDRLGLARFVSLLGESSFSEKALSLWKAGLLSSPKTHIANILANSAFIPLETIKDIPATGFDMARSAITGTPRSKAFGLRTVTSQAGGAVRGAKQGLDFLKSGIDQRDIQKFDALRQVRYGNTKGGRLAQKYVDGVFRLLGAEDKVFREMTFNRSIADQAMVKVVNKDISATELQDLLTNPTEDMVNLAIKDAQTATFNNPNILADGIRRFKSVDPKLAVGADVFMPFVRTPTNVLLRMADYTPAGFAGAVLKKIRSGASITDREFADAFGRSATGMSILAAGYALAQRGLYQGASPSSEGERSQMYLEGRQPMSVKLGDTWYQVSKLSPFSQLLGIGAAYHDASGGVANKTFQAGLQGLKSFSELPMISGLAAATGAVNDPERGGKKYIEQAIGGFSPNIMRGIATGSADVMRSRDTISDSLIAGIPALNQSLPVRVDALGNPIPTNNVTTTLFNPFNPKDVNKDPIVQEFSRVGYNLNYVGDSIDNEKLTPEQQRAYQKLAGAKIREYVQPIIESEEYLSSDTGTQLDIVDNVVTKAKKDAREEIRPLLPSITKGSDRGFKALAAEKEVAKERGGISILKRGDNIGSGDQGNKGTQVDHKEALGLGGTNKLSNQMILTNEENKQKGVVEAHLAREVDKGNITIKEAQKRVEGWKWKDEYKKLKSEDKAVETKAPKTTEGKIYKMLDPSTGKEIKIDISEELVKPDETGKAELDKSLLSSFNSKITTRINNIQKLYRLGKLTAQEAEDAILEVKALKESAEKAKGKAKKGVRVSMPKIKASSKPVISASKASKPTPLRIKAYKPAKIKFAKSKPIKVTRKVARNKSKPIKFKNTLSESLTKLV